MFSYPFKHHPFKHRPAHENIRVHPFIEVFTTKVPLRGSEAQDPTNGWPVNLMAINAIGI
jgi:hypothetical protein